ncbi:MAG: ribosomal-processing cysteine protease Prp [[Eubacterium] siraeum]
MTRVRIDKSGLGRDIYITGHCANENSGSTEATLVCAAMTTLAQTIAQNVFDSEDTGDTDIIDVTLRSGQAVISCVTDDDG